MSAHSQLLARGLARSLERHGQWLAATLAGKGSVAAPRSLRRALTLAAGLPPYGLLQASHWLGFAADTVLFPSAREQDIGEPLFVLGVPRSGTTYVHRLLAEADDHRSSFTTWEALLAPAISQRALWRRAFALHEGLGAPLNNVSGLMKRLLGEDFDAVHEVGLFAPEEDYLALLPLAACFLAVLAFPDDERLWQLGRLDAMDAAERALLLDAYARLLQKHRFAAGGRPLLSKNAAFASWTGALAERFPGARFLICVREPEAALSSQLSAIESGRRLFGIDPDSRHLPGRFAELYSHWYRHLAEQAERQPQRMAVVDQNDLARNPGLCLSAALAQIGEPPRAALQQRLDAEQARARGHHSRHRHSLRLTDIAAPAVRAAMQRDYQRLRALRPEPLQKAS